jgi:hypothetical protein
MKWVSLGADNGALWGDCKRLTGGQLSQIKSTFDMNGMNGSRTCDAVKLAGNWWVVAPVFKHPAGMSWSDGAKAILPALQDPTHSRHPSRSRLQAVSVDRRE